MTIRINYLQTERDNNRNAGKTRELKSNNINGAGAESVPYQPGRQNNLREADIQTPPPEKSLPYNDTEKQKTETGAPADICKCDGDPVNMATGAFLYEDNDFILPESTYDFRLIRRYSSVRDIKTRKSIGYMWTLSTDTAITKDGELTIVTLPDSKAVEYIYKDGCYINKRGNTKQYTLKRPKDNFIFTDNQNSFTYIYDKTGKIQSIKDRHGNLTKYTYCEYGIKKVELSTGLSLTFTWKDMKISEIKDNGGRTVKYHYEKGILRKVERCDGTGISYTYDEKGNLITVTDANGVTYLKNQYDEKKRVTVQHLSDGGLIKFTYNEKEKTNTCTDETNGVTTYYTYDDKLDIIKITYHDKSTEITELDENGLIIKQIDREGAATLYKNDIYGHIIEKKEPSGLITHYTYDKNNIIKITDNEGREETYTYDEKNNIKTVKKHITKENGKEKTLEYRYSYDEKGRLTKTEKNGKTENQYIYGKNHNRPTEEIKNTGETIRKKYDQYLRIIEKETSRGTEKYSYTPYNKIQTYENGKKAKTSYYYDKAWRLIKKVTPENNKLGTEKDTGKTYAYDDFDRLISITDETGNTIEYKRNTNGDITETKISGKTVEKNDYDKDFNLIRKHTYIENRTQTQIKTEKYQYNKRGELTKKIPASCYNNESDNGAGYEYIRDKAGKITEVYDPYGNLTDSYKYDKHGNVTVHKHSYKAVNTEKAIEINNYIKTNDKAGDLYAYDLQGKMTEKRELTESDR